MRHEVRKGRRRDKNKKSREGEEKRKEERRIVERECGGTFLLSSDSKQCSIGAECDMADVELRSRQGGLELARGIAETNLHGGLQIPWRSCSP